MSFVKNLLALIGLLVLVAVVATYVMYRGTLSGFDPGAVGAYTELAEKVLETGNGAEATIWKVPVADGLSADEVGELPLYKDVVAKTGGEYRFVKIYMFCNSLTAKNMLDYNDAFSAYLPCRITLIEDKQGRLWLYTLNMDLMIYGGEPLPAELKAEALKVKKIILDIMNRGAKGEF